MAEATEQSEGDHDDSVQNFAAHNAAKDRLAIPKNRMQTLYNLMLYLALAKRELTVEDRITGNMGGTLAPMGAPGGIGGTVAVSQVAPLPPAEAATAYQKRTRWAAVSGPR